MEDNNPTKKENIENTKNTTVKQEQDYNQNLTNEQKIEYLSRLIKNVEKNLNEENQKKRK